MASFRYYRDESDEWRWQLKADNGKVVADSGEGYRQRPDCVAGSELFRRLGPDAPVRNLEREGPGGGKPEWEMYEDSAGEWRWRFQAGNNRILADSSEGYDSPSNCQRAIHRVKEILRGLDGASGGGSSGRGGFTPPSKPSDPSGGRFA